MVVSDIKGDAWIEGDYRYSLTRIWSPGTGRMCSIMINPSTADGKVNDQTLLRNIHFARAWGYGELEVVNPFAKRSPYPKALLECEDPVGPKNDEAIETALENASLYLVAWGNPPSKALLQRIKAIETLIIHRAIQKGVQVVCLGLTMHGYPKHPHARGVHRVRDDQQPIPYVAKS